MCHDASLAKPRAAGEQRHLTGASSQCPHYYHNHHSLAISFLTPTRLITLALTSVCLLVAGAMGTVVEDRYGHWMKRAEGQSSSEILGTFGHDMYCVSNCLFFLFFSIYVGLRKFYCKLKDYG